MEARGVELGRLLKKIQEDLRAALITRGDQSVLVANMVVERTLGRPDICGDLIERCGIDPLTIEESRCGREDAPSLFFQDRFAVEDAESARRERREIDRLDLRRIASIDGPAMQQEILRDLEQARPGHGLKRRCGAWSDG